MITLTMATVTGAPGMSHADMDAATVQAASLLGGPTSSPETAADFLRDVYADVLRTAGSVDLQAPVVAGIAVAA